MGIFYVFVCNKICNSTKRTICFGCFASGIFFIPRRIKFSSGFTLGNHVIANDDIFSKKRREEDTRSFFIEYLKNLHVYRFTLENRNLLHLRISYPSVHDIFLLQIKIITVFFNIFGIFHFLIVVARMVT